jgi:uncharacterized protein
MRFTQDSNSGIHIRGYARGELRTNQNTYRETVIVSAAGVVSVPELRQPDDLLSFDTSRILSLDPELVLLGTGERQIIPAAAFRAVFLRAAIGFEFMDTGAACRTYNVLVAEQRRAVALLLL